MTLLSAIGSMSRIEYCNCGLGYIEEVALSRVHFKEALYGFSRTLSFRVVNAWRCEPLIECGTQTAVASAVLLTDTAADFFRRGIVPGDIIINSTDCCSIFDVTGVVSKTVLCVRLNTAGGSGSSCNFATSDVYTIRRKNAERVFVPNKTAVRMINRITCIEVFNGVVMEIDPVGGEQARNLCVIASAFDLQLRDASPTINVATAAIRSTVIGDIFDDKTCQNQLVFPLVAGDERSPGIEVSPNCNKVNDDWAKSQRFALPSILDLASHEMWARTRIENLATPTSIFMTTNNACPTQVEMTLQPEGGLATRFEANCQFCIAKVTLCLNKLGCPTGNIYIRIEPEEPTISGIDPIPSGYLVAPNAESALILAADMLSVLDGCCCPQSSPQEFTFDGPVPIAPCKGYWIVLAYQEKNNDYSACSVAINWRINTCDAVTSCCMPVADRATGIYASGSWTSNTADSFLFTLHRFSEAVWFFDYSATKFLDRTSCVEADDANNMSLMAESGSCDVKDRMYVGVAGPIRGLVFNYCTASSAEYGNWSAKYYGSHRAKIYGTITTADAGAGGVNLALIDSTKNFSKMGLCVGDIVYNITDNSVGILTVINPCGIRTQVTVRDLFTNEANSCTQDKVFAIGDEYAVLCWDLIVCGKMDGASCSVLTDSTKCFAALGVRVGDLLVNVTDNLVSFINSYTTTTVTVDSGAMSLAACDCYTIHSRWRTLNIREIDNTFITPTATTRPVIFEWTIPADWEPIRFENQKGLNLGPEFVDPGFKDSACCSFQCPVVVCSCQQRYFLVFQNDSIPSVTPAEIDLMTSLPGAGFGVRVGNTPRCTVICTFTCAASNSCNATLMSDISRDFHGDGNTVGIFVNDNIENSTDGSSGTITAITTLSTAASELHCQLTAALTGGSDNSWDTSDKYILRRNQYPLEYYRLGSRPLGGATRYGLTFICGGKGSCQMISMYSSDVSKSSKSATNRVNVTGKVINTGTEMCPVPELISGVVEDKRGQREFKRTVEKNIVDLSVDTAAEVTIIGEAEISRFVDAQERVQAMTYGWPHITKLVDRKAWRLVGASSNKDVMDANQFAETCCVDGFAATGGTATTLIDTQINFHKWGITRGDVVRRISDCLEMIITGLTTTTNANDTLVGTGFTSTWANGNCYQVYRREMLQVGELVRVRIADHVAQGRQNVNECYLVTNIEYTEPGQNFNVRLQRNFSSAGTGDYRDDGEMFSFMGDHMRRLGQLFRCTTGLPLS